MNNRILTPDQVSAIIFFETRVKPFSDPAIVDLCDSHEALRVEAANLKVQLTALEILRDNSEIFDDLAVSEQIVPLEAELYEHVRANKMLLSERDEAREQAAQAREALMMFQSTAQEMFDAEKAKLEHERDELRAAL